MIHTCQPAGGTEGIGAPCVLGTECAAGLECQTAGAGDAEAYCTNRDCQSDDECIDGYFCGIMRDPHGVCDTNPPKGDNNFCGTTSDPCISVDANGLATDGTSRFEGSLCMLRRSCFKRAQGALCTSDLDCSQKEAQKCTAYAGESRCSRTCAGDDDCTPDNHCDTSAGACVPRFTAWASSGGGFCEPCFSDEDCGGVGTSWACVELSGGTRGCLDQSFPDACTTDLDCPLSPSGDHGTCIDEALGVSPGDPIYHRCYAVFDPVTYQIGCW
jgi:hypothetical protein